MRKLIAYLAARVLPALATMTLTFVCIHELDAASYGRYSLTLWPALLGASLIGGFAGQSMLRHERELTPVALREGLGRVPLLASLAVLPLVLLYLALTVGLGPASWLAVAAVPLVALIDTRRSFFVARGAARAVLAMDTLRAFAALAIAFALFQWRGPTLAAPFVAQLAALALALVAIRVSPVDAEPKRTRGIDRAYATYGFWFAGWMGVTVGLSLAERTVVEAVSGLAASGAYAAQADVVNAVFTTAAAAIAFSMMPAYLGIEGRSLSPFHRLSARAVAGLVAVACGCLLAGAVLHGRGELVVARKLAEDAATGGMLVAASFLWAAAGFWQKPLELRGRTRALFVAVALAFAFFLVVARPMAHAFGPVGVAMAKALAAMVFIALVALLARRERIAPPPASPSSSLP